MDHVDAAILRELWDGGSLGMARHDPRIRMSALAKSIGLDRSSVRDRLRRWRDEGFLTHFHVVPNPALFGYTVTGSAVHVDDPRHKVNVRAALEQVEETLAWIDHVGPWLGIASICSSPMHGRTLQQLYASFPGVTEASPLFDSGWPKKTVPITPLDWRIIHAMRHNPDAALQDLAKTLHVSPSTLTRRYERLVTGSAVMVVPEVDFTHYKGASLVRMLIHLSESADPTPIARELRHRPETIVAYAMTPPGSKPFVDVYSHFESPGMVGVLESDARAMHGVTEIEVLWPRDHRVFPEALDAHLERAMQEALASEKSR